MSEVEHDNERIRRIAVLGAGPVGLEAALYARYLGYHVAVFEQGGVAENVRRWGHVTMFSPFRLNRSTLGIAALQAQDPGAELPADDELLSGQQYAERYLIPLSKSDLLSDCVFEHVEVVAVGRDGLLKNDLLGADRANHAFRILIRNQGREETVDADVVIDSTGVYDQPNFMGHGGIPAVGELELRPEIHYHIPDIAGCDQAAFANKSILIVGSGYSAATCLVGLSQLRHTAPATEITWMTRRAPAGDGPITRIPQDRLPQRDQLARQANQLCRDAEGGIRHWGQTSVVSLRRDDGQFVVGHAGAHAGETHFDAVIANVGFRPNDAIFSELQVHQCYASQGPMKLAASLLKADSVDCLDQRAGGPEVLRNPEPDFFVLGSKAYGRNSNFLLAVGLEQIRDAFTIIADREDLDLYKTMEHLVS